MIPPEISSLLELRERLMWWDRPKRSFVLRTQDFLMVPFSLVWCTGTMLGAYKAITDIQHPLAIAITAVFSLLGIYIVIGRFFHDSWRRSRLVYAVTDRRVLIVSPARVRSMDLESLAEMELKGPREGSGSISFGPVPGLFTQADLGMWIGRPAVPTFEFIRDHDRVFTLIRDLRRKARESASAS